MVQAHTRSESCPCADCIAGRADEDLNASTPCAVCANGSFATLHQLLRPVRAWLGDSDSNAATPCAECPRGQYSSLTGRIGGCDKCIAGRYAAASANLYEDSCEACSTGQYAGNGSAACESCAPGTADVDENPGTSCSTCPNGTYASCGGTTCSACEPGQVDSDSDSATPCVECTPGQYWEDGELAGTTRSGCTHRSVRELRGGKQTIVTAPHLVSMLHWRYSGAGSTSCDNCGLVGLVDHDDDPTTPCMAVGGACTQFCEQGTEDADCDLSTPCTECAEGQFAEGGYFVEGQTQCRPCAPGSYAAPGSAPADCRRVNGSS